MNIVFMGTPDFAVESLEALYNAGHNILAVVTKVDSPSGRGMNLVPSPVKVFAEEKGLKVLQPEKIKNNEEFMNEIKAMNPELIVVVAYGKILPQEFLDIPRYGCVNVHGSLLPKYRGAAPIQWAVLNGDHTTGITTMFMDAGMDTGDMILRVETPIDYEETTGQLWARMAKLGANLLIETMNRISSVTDNKFIENVAQLKSEIGARKQGDDYTMAPMLSKDMALIDWSKSANEIHNLVRGLDPIMGAYTYINGKKLKIWKTYTRITSEKYAMTPGEILDITPDGILVQTGEKTILIQEVQAENSKRMSVRDYLNGNQIEKHQVFGK
jgi:methionyl-tRNA formyltransferase